jgi:hypothetical protein
MFELPDSWPRRLGSCGCLTELPVGSVVIPKASIAVTRNYDFDLTTGNSQECPYKISKPVRGLVRVTDFSILRTIVTIQVSADPDLHLAVNITGKLCVS